MEIGTIVSSGTALGVAVQGQMKQPDGWVLVRYDRNVCISEPVEEITEIHGLAIPLRDAILNGARELGDEFTSI